MNWEVSFFLCNWHISQRQRTKKPLIMHARVEVWCLADYRESESETAKSEAQSSQTAAEDSAEEEEPDEDGSFMVSQASSHNALSGFFLLINIGPGTHIIISMSYRYSSCCCCCCWSGLFKNSLRLRRFKSDRDEILQECSSIKRGTYQLTESDFRFDAKLSRWRPWRHFTQKSSAILWWVHMKRLPSRYLQQLLFTSVSVLRV